MTRQGRYPRELRERAVRMVFEHQDEHPSQWAAITSIAAKFGVSSEVLRKWVRRAVNGQAKVSTGGQLKVSTLSSPSSLLLPSIGPPSSGRTRPR
jgi:transposase-like protein